MTDSIIDHGVSLGRRRACMKKFLTIGDEFPVTSPQSILNCPHPIGLLVDAKSKHLRRIRGSGRALKDNLRWSGRRKRNDNSSSEV